MEETVGAPPIERASPDDVVSLATDVGPVPMQVAAILVLDTAGGFDAEEAVAAVGRRIGGVPRLRQRLVHAPFGCGRPYWVDDADFAIDRHVRVVPCPGSGGEADLLALSAELVATALPADRPLWSATFVPGLAQDRTGLVMVFHHVLADGIGGLAVLASLVDGAVEVPLPASFPRPWPSTRQLARDALAERLHALAHVRATVRRLRDAVTELRSARPDPPPPTSLNRPTGARRSLAIVRAELEPIHAAARANGATVNDAVLTAVAGALAQLLAGRGEQADRFVISVPVSARREATASDLGNQVGAVPIGVPAVGDERERLATIAERTRAARGAPRGASSAVLGPAFRVLGRLGLFGWFIDRQHLVTTFATNLRGPDTRLTFCGAPILEVLPVAVVTGNVTVSFAVLSYAGTLAVTIIADPEVCPDLATLRDDLDEQLAALADPGGPSGGRSDPVSDAVGMAPADPSHHDHPDQGETDEVTDPAEFWEARYRHRQQWSGRANPVLVEVVGDLAPGRALDLGCGEGGDAIWLAERGWHVTAADISSAALARGAEHAAEIGVGGRITWERHDLSRSFPAGAFDLVSAQFLHSPVELHREPILLRARDAVAPGGVLLIVGHAEPPPWAPPAMRHHAHLPLAADVVAHLELPAGWAVERVEQVEREATGPDGQTGLLSDSVVLARRGA